MCRGRSRTSAWRRLSRQVCTDSLTSRHSGISNDVLLFSDISLSLVHHYRVHKRGLPHVAFRRNYMSQLRALLPLPAVLPIEGGSPDPACSSVVESPDVVCASPRYQPVAGTPLPGAQEGPPHVAFRRNYMSQLRALLPLHAVLPIEGGSPDPACSSVVESPDVVCASPRPSRRAIGRRRPTRVMETPIRIAPRLTIQDPLAAAGAVVLD